MSSRTVRNINNVWAVVLGGLVGIAVVIWAAVALELMGVLN